MMGVTFAAVGPMVVRQCDAGAWTARAIFGAIIGAGVISILIAPVVSKMLRFFPPVVTGTIIAIIGISLMRVGVDWAMGGPANLGANVDVPKLVAKMVDAAKQPRAGRGQRAQRCEAAGRSRWSTTPTTARSTTWRWPPPSCCRSSCCWCLRQGLLVANISVLLGIVAGCASSPSRWAR